MTGKMFRGYKVMEEKVQNQSLIMGKPVFHKEVEGEVKTINDLQITKNLETAFEVLSNGDDKPFFFISEMLIGEEHPTAYGEIMTKEWADTFVAKLDNAPFPLSALGHTNVSSPMERVESHGYVVGGSASDKSLKLLNYLSRGNTDEQQAFRDKTIREMKAGMLSTSISNYQRYMLIEDEDKGTSQWYVTESLTGQRNDIVEHDLTGADATIVARSFKDAPAEDSALNIGEDSMDKLEMLKKLSTLKKNGDLSNAEIATSFGLELVTDDMTANQSALKEIQTALGEGNPLDLIASLKKKSGEVDEARFEKVRDEALKEVFKDTEALLEDATELFALEAGDKEACLKEATRISNLKVITNLASSLAGSMSKGASFKVIGKTGVKSSGEAIVM